MHACVLICKCIVYSITILVQVESLKNNLYFMLAKVITVLDTSHGASSLVSHHASTQR